MIGAAVGALLQAWREHAMHRRELAVRWDEALLTGRVDYLSTADRTLRGLLRWRRARDAGASTADLDAMATAALETYESLHEQSQLISLLTGDRTDPLRVAAREMRRSLLPLCDEARGGEHLENSHLIDLINAHRAARDSLILRAQRKLKGDLEQPATPSGT
ncbi:hypothetical protein H9Y04_01930 [Streptomyces sp. TRM66268-LWL]|uniref:Uncharacterized protein n=1 Tax=Streptomyces polyasparticus TaxID=2767826 RepID=A0ABR7SAG0_9ACTN|nr:hypothetical protein [Streptomyces polyasparticus]MBC9711328.1 hypothetical protein [Streptomyces polyasparticus]